jgi:hypothetical protein
MSWFEAVRGADGDQVYFFFSTDTAFEQHPFIKTENQENHKWNFRNFNHITPCSEKHI